MASSDDFRLVVAVLVSFFSVVLCSDVCTNNQGNVRATLLCNDGCCGPHENQQCCEPNTVVLVVSIVCGILGVLVIVAICTGIYCCVRRRRGASGQVVRAPTGDPGLAGPGMVVWSTNTNTTNAYVQPMVAQYDGQNANCQPMAGQNPAEALNQPMATGQSPVNTSPPQPMGAEVVNSKPKPPSEVTQRPNTVGGSPVIILAIESRCDYCGGTQHARRKCPAYGVTCRACGKRNHWDRVCRSNPQETRNQRGPNRVTHKTNGGKEVRITIN